MTLTGIGRKMLSCIFLILLCTLCTAGWAADIPSILILGDDRSEDFSQQVEKTLVKKIAFYPSAKIPLVRYISVKSIAAADKYLQTVKRGDFRVLLVCCSNSQTDSISSKCLIRRASKIGMEVLWFGAESSVASRSGVCMADYDGFCKALKKDGDKLRSEYIAEAAAQWWTGIARSNRGVERIKLWSNKPPQYEYQGNEYINALARLDRISEPELEVFLPVQTKLAPVVIFFPGGGYSFTGFLRNARELAEILIPQGVAVIGLKYRTKRGASVALEDAQRAVRMVRSRAQEWNLDTRLIGVAGQSAGAHLVLNLSTHFSVGDPSAKDAIERQSSRPDFAAPLTSWNFGSNDSPFMFDKNTPPFFVRQARNDSSFLLAEKIVAQLQHAAVPVDWQFVDTGGHGAFEIVEGNNNNSWTDDFIKWIKAIELDNK